MSQSKIVSEIVALRKLEYAESTTKATQEKKSRFYKFVGPPLLRLYWVSFTQYLQRQVGKDFLVAVYVSHNIFWANTY